MQDWLDAQYSVLGSMLISPETVPIVLSQMSDSDFSGSVVSVFQAIRLLFTSGVPVDPVTVIDKIGKNYTNFIMQLMEITPTAANVQAYIDVAKRQSRTVRLREIGQQMADEDDPDRMRELLSQAVAINSERNGIRAVKMHEAMIDFFERHNPSRKVEYIKWPIPELNDQLFLDKGDFVIIGGKPSAGKTAFALQAAWEQSVSKSVGFFSIETGLNKLTDRQTAAGCGIPMENIKRNCLSDAHLSKASEFSLEAEKMHRFEMICEAHLTVADIQAFSAARGYDIIYIDYLQMLSSTGSSPYEKVSNLSLDLHRFAQSANCAVVALSQLSRPGAAVKGADPDMSSLRDSGQLEQDADAVLLLYLEDEKQPNGRRVLKCAKNKEGERFRIMLDFDGKTQIFSKSKTSGNYSKEMARINRERKETEKYEKERQLQILPDDTAIPFDA